MRRFEAQVRLLSTRVKISNFLTRVQSSLLHKGEKGLPGRQRRMEDSIPARDLGQGPEAPLHQLLPVKA